jgi:ABC-type antimicrobial peptide transport system permease subunit
VLLRNVVSRRRELALLRAVGYQSSHIRLMLLAETGSLLVAGLLVGAAAALLAGLPAIVERGGRMPVSAAGASVVGAVLLAGLVATVVAAQSATRQPLLDALRSE